MIIDYLKFTNGFYIEAGAHDGVFQSNTIYLEQQLNWKGLLIEPNKDNYARCKSNRSTEANIILNCALVSSDYPENTVCGSFVDDGKCTAEGQIVNHIAPHFDQHKLQEIETIKNTRVISCIEAKPLQHILDLYKISNIDFLSLDVENYEEEVLKGIDFSKNSPKYMLIETGNSRIREKNINEYVYQFNYEIIWRQGNDSFYKIKL